MSSGNSTPPYGPPPGPPSALSASGRPPQIPQRPPFPPSTTISPAHQRLMLGVYKVLIACIVLLLIAAGVFFTVAAVQSDDDDKHPRQEVRWAVPAISEADFARAVREHYLEAGPRELTVLAAMSDAEIAAEGRAVCERMIAGGAGADSVGDLMNRRGAGDANTWAQYVAIVDRAGALMCPYQDVEE